MIQSISAGSAKSYFANSLIQADYYINDQELQGRFHGKLAERLGLAHEASKDAFFALCENKHPNDLSPLTARTKQERTVGYDINFHCPKSVSIVHVLSKDSHIMTMFQASVHETMKQIEMDVMGRVRKDGKYQDRKTGELVYAEFTHQTARPVGDKTPDPHLHSHCFVFNATWDAKEQTIKAAQFRDIKRDMPFYQAYFHKVLSDKMIEEGYQVRKTKNSFELVGVPKEIIAHFSKRTNEIGQIAKEKGITSAKDLDALGARTRGKKQKGMSMDELRADWKKQIHEVEADPDYTPSEEPGTLIRHAPKVKSNKPTINAKDCVDYAVLHAFERASVMAERRIVETALKHSIGQADIPVADIEKTFASDDRILKVKDRGRMVCTTKEVLVEEKTMVDLARRGLGQIKPLYKAAPSLKLTGQQGEAVKHVLTTPNRVSIIRGAAGAGKTKLMGEAVPKIEATGKKVTVIAPSADASRGVLRDEGFENADTVARLLYDQNVQEGLKNQVLWVDEAGLLSVPDMTKLLAIVEKQNTQLILGGDTRQHASVVRGDALRVLNTVGGIRTAEVSEIYRQREQFYKEAVSDLSKGDVLSGFQKLDRIGVIKKTDPLKPNEDLVRDYVDAVKKGKSVMVISPTHAQGEKVTEDIRHALRKKGLIGKKELAARKLTNCNLTEAEKKDWRSFEKGQVVQFNQNVKGIRRGSHLVIDRVEDGQVFMADSEGHSIQLTREHARHFNLYTKSEITFSKGDKVRITNGGTDKDDKRLNTGQCFDVKSVSKKGLITLVNKASKNVYTIDKDFGHVAHAHCVTSHAAQGQTVDEVFIAQPAATFGATDAKQFYVSVSRGRDAAHIYTDNKDELLEHAAELGDRQSALELFSRQQKDHQKYVARNMNKEHKQDKGKDASKDQTFNINRKEHYEPEL